MPDAGTYLELLVRDAGGPPGGFGGAEAAAGDRGARTGALPDKSLLVQRLRAEIEYTGRVTGLDADRDAVDAVLAEADESLSQIFGEGPEATLGTADVAALEAVVRSDGSRPVLFVIDDFVDVTAPNIGAYAASLSLVEDGVRQVCQAVGRVDDPSGNAGTLGYHGTAWAVGEGLVVTNYHVVEEIAPGGVRRDGCFEGRLTTGVAVQFGHEVGNPLPERRFPIRRVVSVGREGAAEYFDSAKQLNFDGLDLAVLELEPVPGRPFPRPLPVARGDDPKTHGGLATAGRSVYLVGYPGTSGGTTPDLFERIFAGVKSFKRLAPGAIMASAGEVPNDPRGWVITHDASTLGGNSGSALVDLEANGRTCLALHFAGQAGRQNWAHAVERMTGELAAALPGPRP
jgi:hypothetical protein